MWKAKIDTREDLRGWIKEHLGLSIPTTSVCGDHHHSPMEYVWSSHKEDKDLVVWAPRGGGKTTLGAVVTLLDLMLKPGCKVRILGGSREQSLRMWEQFVPLLERTAADEIDGEIRNGRVRLKNGSSVAILAQSQRAVRGHRVQKLRCDEVELFDERIWAAAQLVSRSGKTPDGKPIAASLEALSTMHQVSGLMQRVVDGAANAGRHLVHWCLLDVLETCTRCSCDGCALQRDCNGKARRRSADQGGFVQIDDAIRMMRRVSREDWEAEMLCLRPSRQHSVFRSFSREKHVSAADWWQGDTSRLRRTLAIDFGYSAPFVCLWIVSDSAGHVFVLDELHATQRTLAENLHEVRARYNNSFREVTCDPAGNSANSQTSYADIDVLRREGYNVLFRRSLIKDGLEKIRAALQNACGQSTLRIHPRCTQLIRSMENYDSIKPTENPVKDGENDHCVDALRYFYINPPPGPTLASYY